MYKFFERLTIPIVAMCLGILIFSGMMVVSYFNPQTVQADTAQIEEVQTRLKQWGYYDGDITGVLDYDTKQAIMAFQEANDITPTGAIDAQTAEALGIYVSTQTSNDLYLIAKCVYAEARGEPYEGMVAVGAVLLNRVASPDFPNTVYGVIYQPWAFTAVHDGQIDLEPDSTAYQAAQDAMSGWDPSYGSLYYYNPVKATSQWIYSRTVVVVIGSHYFAI